MSKYAISLTIHISADSEHHAFGIAQNLTDSIPGERNPEVDCAILQRVEESHVVPANNPAAYVRKRSEKGNA